MRTIKCGQDLAELTPTYPGERIRVRRPDSPITTIWTGGEFTGEWFLTETWFGQLGPGPDSKGPQGPPCPAGIPEKLSLHPPGKGYKSRVVKFIQRFLGRLIGLPCHTKQLTEHITLKLSEIKAAIAEASEKNAEALAEIGRLVGDLRQQIADLQAGNNDPEVTDEVFTAKLNQLKADADALADIVPNGEAPAPEPEPEPTPEEPTEPEDEETEEPVTPPTE